MELVLNLCWLMLAASASWMWWRHSHAAQPFCKRASGLIALACAVILLFPVISESDDLHAFRPEMEDVSFKAGAGKSAKVFPSAHGSNGHCALPFRAEAPAAERQVVGIILLPLAPNATFPGLASTTPRSPPLSLL